MSSENEKSLFSAIVDPSNQAKSSLYNEEEELNPLGHEIISRKIEVVVPDNLNWPSKINVYRTIFQFFILDHFILILRQAYTCACFHW